MAEEKSEKLIRDSLGRERRQRLDSEFSVLDLQTRHLLLAWITAQDDSQERIAVRAEVPDQSVNGLINGRRGMSVEVMRRVLLAIGYELCIVNRISKKPVAFPDLPQIPKLRARKNMAKPKAKVKAKIKKAVKKAKKS